MRFGLIITAVTAYLAVLGCVLLKPDSAGPSVNGADGGPPFQSPTGAPLVGLPYRGVAMQLQRTDWTEEYKKSIDEIATVGADTVLFVVDTRQENGSSSRIYLDMRMTPSRDMLMGLIKHAKDRKLRVVLMPIVLLDLPVKDEWRGQIKPLDWEAWFDSYRDMITHFAYIAEDSHAEVLVVGSELVSTQDKFHQWRRTINAVRKVYKGQLTYSANWDNYMQVPFWADLDMISMNCYWQLGKDKNASVEEIIGNWRGIQKDIIAYSKKMGKPLMFSEAGWCSLENAASEPWDYTRTADLNVDLELQKRLYEGFFRVWYGNPNLGGFFVWNWEPGDGGPTDKGYTPENKPAEKVLREWMGKPWDGK